MNATHIIVTSKYLVYVWQYKESSVSGRSAALDHIRRKASRERVFSIHDVESSTDFIHDFSQAANLTPKSSVEITAICCSAFNLVVGLSNKKIYSISVPHFTFEETVSDLENYSIPQKLEFNNGGTRIGCIDKAGNFIVICKPDDPNKEKYADLVRKEVWCFRWADDDDNVLSLMEKNKLYVFRNGTPDEPLDYSGWISQFKDLKISLVNRDALVKDIDIKLEDVLQNVDSKALKTTRDIANTVGLSDAVQYVTDNPHAILWKYIANQALKDMDLELAMKSFINCSDYYGIQFVKKLQKITDEKQRHAQAMIFMDQFDEAEQLYLGMDRKDLAIELRTKLGDWFKVLQMVKEGGFTDDSVIESAWDNIGSHYFDRHNW
jgi:WD repeat-containing protein 35